MIFSAIEWSWDGIATFIERVGFPIFTTVAIGAFVFALAWAGWRLIRWTGQEIVIPIRNSVLTFFDSFRESVDDVRSNLNQQTESLREIGEANSEIKRDIAGIHRRLLTREDRNGEAG